VMAGALLPLDGHAAAALHTATTMSSLMSSLPGAGGAIGGAANLGEPGAVNRYGLRHVPSSKGGGGLFFLRSEKRDWTNIGKGGGFFERQGNSDKKEWDSDEEKYDEFGRKKRKRREPPKVPTQQRGTSDQHVESRPRVSDEPRVEASRAAVADAEPAVTRMVTHRAADALAGYAVSSSSAPLAVSQEARVVPPIAGVASSSPVAAAAAAAAAWTAPSACGVLGPRAGGAAGACRPQQLLLPAAAAPPRLPAASWALGAWQCAGSWDEHPGDGNATWQPDPSGWQSGCWSAGGSCGGSCAGADHRRHIVGPNGCGSSLLWGHRPPLRPHFYPATQASGGQWW